MNKTISVIGGDSRQLYAAEYLSNKGYKIKMYAAEHGKNKCNISEAKDISEAFASEIIILPLPVSKNGTTLNTPLSSKEIKLKDITDNVSENHYVFFGMGASNFTKHIQAKSKYSCDYFNIESLIYKNALLTSEGIISIILDKLPTTLFGMSIAVTGYGRIGSLTVDKLMKLGGKVSVFARNEMQKIKAAVNGASAFDITELSDIADRFDAIINTVPFPVVDIDTVKNSKNSCVFIESASAPYGIDGDACVLHGRTLIKAFSLPGKTAPKSAGIIIGETIDSILREVK